MGKAFEKSLLGLVDATYITSVYTKTIWKVKGQYVCPMYNIDNLDFIINKDLQFTINDQLLIDLFLLK